MLLVQRCLQITSSTLRNKFIGYISSRLRGFIFQHVHSIASHPKKKHLETLVKALVTHFCKHAKSTCSSLQVSGKSLCTNIMLLTHTAHWNRKYFSASFQWFSNLCKIQIYHLSTGLLSLLSSTEEHFLGIIKNKQHFLQGWEIFSQLDFPNTHQLDALTWRKPCITSQSNYYHLMVGLNELRGLLQP